jgi:GTP-binding protein
VRVESVEFVQSAARLSQAPAEALPEIAFLGPSNVGKSSLLNALTGRKGLARVSKTPGRTQLLNYFRVNGRVWFVDLPGYGFARAPKRVQAGFLRLVEEYLAGSSRLALLLLLLDCRRDPSTRDLELQAWLVEHDVPHVVVLTKADKLSRSQLQRRARAIEKALGLDRLEAQALPFSAHAGTGRRELWAVIDQALDEAAGSAPS